MPASEMGQSEGGCKVARKTWRVGKKAVGTNYPQSMMPIAGPSPQHIPSARVMRSPQCRCTSTQRFRYC